MVRIANDHAIVLTVGRSSQCSERSSSNLVIYSFGEWFCLCGRGSNAGDRNVSRFGGDNCLRRWSNDIVFVIAIGEDIEWGIDIIGSVQFDTGGSIDDASREDIAIETSWFL
jgi:hypothetical protein